jgi:thymidine phosphorylase
VWFVYRDVLHNRMCNIQMCAFILAMYGTALLNTRILDVSQSHTHSGDQIKNKDGHGV